MKQYFFLVTLLCLSLISCSKDGENAEENNKMTDVTAPTVPLNLTVISYGSSSASLSWNQSTDDKELAGYYIYVDHSRNSSLVSSTSKTVSGLLPNTNYTFKVTAIDKAGNESDFSNEVSITTGSELPVGLGLPAGIKNGDDVEWDASAGTFKFIHSVSFSDMENQDNDQEGFYWEVPSSVKKIIIGANVTITGGFRFKETITIEGEDRTTSRIFGTNTPKWALGPNGISESECGSRLGDDRAHDCEKWNYGAISHHKQANRTAVFTIKNLTVENARTYAITTFDQKLIVDNVHIINTRTEDDYHSNSDGIGGGEGTTITNTKIDTWDDGIKLYKNTTVRNVTIILNANGAPLQLGWSSKSPTQHVIDNVKIIPSSAGPTKHNLTAISASLTSGDLDATLKLEGSGLFVDFTTRAGLTIRTNDPLPLVWLKSPGAKLTIDNTNNAPISLNAPAGKMGDGTVALINVCGQTSLLPTTICNTQNGVATGAPF